MSSGQKWKEARLSFDSGLHCDPALGPCPGEVHPRRGWGGLFNVKCRWGISAWVEWLLGSCPRADSARYNWKKLKKEAKIEIEIETKKFIREHINWRKLKHKQKKMKLKLEKKQKNEKETKRKLIREQINWKKWNKNKKKHWKKKQKIGNRDVKKLMKKQRHWL
jgi:hypothetical protein